MNMIRRIQFTKEGYEDFQKEYLENKNNRVFAVADLKTAREMGDLSENAAYKVARSRLSRIDANIRRIERVLKNAVVVEGPRDGYMDIGSRLTIDDGSGAREILLVEGYESDFMKGKISVYSPIGKALRGKRKGDRVRVITPGGIKEYRII